MLAQLQNYIVEEDRAFRSAIAWNAEERRLRGQDMIAREILPRRQGIVTIAEKIELLNNQETIAAKQANFLEFGRLQNNLSEFLMLALISGFLLAVVSAIYILRLERQARFRYAELVNSRTELQQLSARLVDAQETERRAISRELHDEVGQALGLLLMDAGRLSNQLGPSDEKGQEIVRSIKTVAERTVQTVRSMALLLRPSMLDDLGLVPAVEWYAREMSRRGETEVEVRAENISDTLSDPLKLCVYRMVQESLNNANRHAHAKNVTVDLKQSANSISVKIEDDGSGLRSETYSRDGPSRHGRARQASRWHDHHRIASRHAHHHSRRASRRSQPKHKCQHTARHDTRMSPNPRKIRILLADDHTLIRRGLRLLIEQQPELIVVGEAEDGRQAVAQAAQLKPDVAVLDIGMPNLNGIEAAKQISESDSKTSIVILSMYSDETYILRALKAGARGYLLKDSAESDLVRAIHSVAEGKSFFSPTVSRVLLDDYVQKLKRTGGENSYDLLTAREREVLQLVAEGRSNKEVADLLNLSVYTVETHRSNIMEKLNLKGVPELILYAVRKGIIS